MAETEFKYDIFISYSNTDEDWVVDTLLPRLEKAKLKVSIHFRDFPAGRPAIINMQEAAEISRHTVLVMTPDWVSREWTLYEGILTRTNDPAGLQARTIPLLLKKCDVPKFISMLTWVDFTRKDREDMAWKQLLDALGRPTRTKKIKPPKATRADWCLKHPYSEIPDFTGRVKERQMLADWLKDDKHPLLVLRALGGFGKSALTWYWIKNDLDPTIWSKVVWWSFYDDREFGNFVRETLEYLTGKLGNPTGTRQDVENLLNELEKPGILLVLDGFERALRVFSSMDAAYQEDDKTKIENERDTDCVSLLAEYFLKGVSTLPDLQSKVLMTTRLRPHILNGHGGMLLTGCDEKELTALDKVDAVDFFHHLGIKGTRAEIESACEPYGFHPLSLRLLSGLIVKDFEHPRDISVAQKFNIIGDLKQRQHHVLEQSYNSLTPERQTLFSRIACFRGSIDYKALRAIAEKEATFDDDIHDLVERGLLHHTESNNKFDIHPIVRRYAYERLTAPDRTAAHTRLRDYFAAVDVPEQVQTLDDLAPVIELYHHMVRGGNLDEARKIFKDRLDTPTYYQFGAYQLQIELLRALFLDGEDKPPRLKSEYDQGDTLNDLASVYALSGQPRRAVPIFQNAVLLVEKMGDKKNVAIGLVSVASGALLPIGALSAAEGNLRRQIDLCREIADEHGEAYGHQVLGRVLSYRGTWQEAEQELDKGLELFLKARSRKDWISKHWAYSSQLSYMTTKLDTALQFAEDALRFSIQDANEYSPVVRDFVRNYWILGRANRVNGELDKAEENLSKAISMCRQINLVDHEADILLDLARLRYDQKNYEEAKNLADEALSITERCGYVLQGADVNLFLAELTLTLDPSPEGRGKAREYAETALKLAYCDGPPYYYKVAYHEAERFLENLK